MIRNAKNILSLLLMIAPITFMYITWKVKVMCLICSNYL